MSDNIAKKMPNFPTENIFNLIKYSILAAG